MKLAYKDYLKSNHWKEMKKLYKKGFCQLCGHTEHLHLHHITYRRLGKEFPLDLITLCDFCHEIMHTSYKGYRVSTPNSHTNIVLKCIQGRRQLTEGRVRRLSLAIQKVLGGKRPKLKSLEMFSSLQEKGHYDIRKYLIDRIPTRSASR